MAHNTNQIIKKFVSYNHVSNFKYISGRHVAIIVSRIEVIFECPDSSSGELSPCLLPHWNVNSTIEKTVRLEDRLVCEEREEGGGYYGGIFHPASPQIYLSNKNGPSTQCSKNIPFHVSRYRDTYWSVDPAV